MPCHHIPLGPAGETVEGLEPPGNQQLLEEKVKAWLRARIREIEDRREADVTAAHRIF